MIAEATRIDTLLEIGGLLGSAAADDPGAAQEVLGLIHRIVPYAAASISAYDPLDGRHRTLAATGYSDRIVEHLDNWFVTDDAVYRHMRTVDPTPLRWRDMPFDYREMYSAQEMFLPGGFREGVTVCLHTRGEQRYTGNLHLSTDEPTFPGDPADVCRLQCLLAGFTDRLRPLARRVLAAGPGAHAAVVRPDATVTPITEHDPGPHLVSHQALAAAVAAALRDGGPPRRCRWQDGAGHWHRVDTTRLAEGAFVIEQARPLPCALSAREIEVLTGVCAGLTNPEIAAELFVATKTVAKHVEHVLHKLSCATRTAAAVYAATHGLVSLAPPR